MHDRDYGIGALWIIFLPILLPVSLFVGNIFLFDALLVSVALGLLANNLLHIHPALTMVIGIVIMVVVYKLYRTNAGFWILSAMFTLAVSGVIGALIYNATGSDLIWGWVSFGLGACVLGWLHYKNKDADTLDFLDVLFLN